MSRQLISRNDDLKALRDDGYEVAVQAGHLVLRHVPYVNAQKQVKRGTLVSVLELSGDATVKPSDHKALFAGEHPCDKDGRRLKQLEHSSNRSKLGGGLTVDHSFSAKPKDGNGYRDYHHKMQTYAEMISAPARAIDPNATARTYIVPPDEDAPDPVFNYVDSASTRAGIGAITDKLALGKVGIVGLGGSGSYVLDLIAKTPIREIHLFDGDDFLQHNAFRGPGAPGLDTLRDRPRKVDYFAGLYALMRKGLVPHPVHIDADNLDLLDGMAFVFLCVDAGDVKRPIVEKLEADGIPFIDVGMGIYEADGKLGGVLRVTASTPDRRDHLDRHVSFDGGADDVYAQNIQIADLNALNATLAVIKWKKLCGFYADFEQEHASTYTIDGNMMSNAEKVE
ncbi:ThiF family adenylyltransferase [Amorphus sp. 3PC139-8]|uniref:ThiF family adenylyltransferase n=1 Tax=Amorphus sp. 3PC139-8 TaxID=2735676 RepID=UPI00345D30FC